MDDSVKPVCCQVVHNPPHSYGDCLRACIASIMDQDVPHFLSDGCDGATAHARIQQWLGTQNLTWLSFSYDDDWTLDELMDHMGLVNPFTHYILLGTTETGGSHAVVCRGDRIVHNPAFGENIVGPIDNFWPIYAITIA
jgi:hypothetical protein